MKTSRVLLGRRSAAIEIDLVAVGQYRWLSPDIDLSREHLLRRGRRTVERQDAIRVVVVRLGAEVGPGESLDRVLSRGDGVARHEIHRHGGEQLHPFEPVRLTFGMIGAVDRKAEQTVAEFLRQVHSEDDDVATSDGLYRQIACSIPDAHGATGRG